MPPPLRPHLAAPTRATPAPPLGVRTVRTVLAWSEACWVGLTTSPAHSASEPDLGSEHDQSPSRPPQPPPRGVQLGRLSPRAYSQPRRRNGRLGPADQAVPSSMPGVVL